MLDWRYSKNSTSVSLFLQQGGETFQNAQLWKFEVASCSDLRAVLSGPDIWVASLYIILYYIDIYFIFILIFILYLYLYL